MILLVAVISALILISFTCSILESIILSITEPYIQLLIDQNRKSGQLLRKLKERIDDPISAILTLNTIANTAGATIAGAIALRLFGSQWMALFSGVLTLAILIFAEIIPKTLGASYWKTIAPAAGWVLNGMVIILRPITIPVNFIARLLSRQNQAIRVSKEEVINTIRLGYLQGVIESSEFEIVENLFQLKTITVNKIMTPRTVVLWLLPEQTTGSLLGDSRFLQFSRLPLYDPSENRVTGIVLRRDIMNRIAHDVMDQKLYTLAAKPEFVAETMSVYTLLDRLISRKMHLAVVLNEYGDYTGIVTMEDAVETLLGREIVDESDRVINMRELARQRMSTWLSEIKRGNRRGGRVE
ncbi:MAG: CNNM domain-containing protein [Chitinivibrionales bacterium]